MVTFPSWSHAGYFLLICSFPNVLCFDSFKSFKGFCSQLMSNWLVCSFLICLCRFTFKVMPLCISHPFSSETSSELSKLTKTSTKVSPVPTVIPFSILWWLQHQSPKTWSCGRSPGMSHLCYSPGVQRVHLEVPEEFFWLCTTVNDLKDYPESLWNTVSGIVNTAASREAL